MIEIANIVTTNCRIPIEYRINKQNAIFLLEKIEQNFKRDDIINNDLFVLAAWANKSFFEFVPNEEYTIVKKILQQEKKEATWDLTLPKTHSLTVNGLVCHNTANVPKNASHELISEMYINAWKSGCKGFTVYRDGSRSGVLLTGQNSSWFDGVPNDELLKMIEVSQVHHESMSSVYLQFIKDVQQELSIRSGKEVEKKLHVCGDVVPTRPKKLPCDIHRLKIITNGVPEIYMALVGLLDGVPYEVFCGLAEHIELPKKPTKGIIIKNGKKAGVATYNLMIPLGVDEDDGIVFHDIVDAFANKNYGAFSRTLSLALRHRIPINVIVEQLLKDKFSDMSSFNRVIARVLKTYIPDGTAVTSGTDKKCPNCGNETLIYMEGCVKCASGCGWSKC